MLDMDKSVFFSYEQRVYTIFVGPSNREKLEKSLRENLSIRIENYKMVSIHFQTSVTQC